MAEVGLVHAQWRKNLGPVEQPERHLGELLLCYREGLCSPLPFYPRTALAYAKGMMYLPEWQWPDIGRILAGKKQEGAAGQAALSYRPASEVLLSTTVLGCAPIGRFSYVRRSLCRPSPARSRRQ